MPSPHESRYLDVAFGWRILDAVIWFWRRIRIARARPAAGYILALPGVCFVGILLAGLVYLGWKSAHAYDAFLGKQGGISDDNYVRLNQISYFPEVVYRTLLTATVVTIVSLAIAVPLAYTMVRTASRRVRFVLLWVLFLPILTGEIVRAYGWIAVLSGNGLVPAFVHAVGLGHVDLLGTEWAVAIGIIQLIMPLSTLLLLPAIHTIEPEIEAAASVLGARPRQVWLHVILPLARPGIAVTAALGFTLSVSSLAMPQLLGLGLHDFVGNVIQGVFFTQNDVALGSAMGIVVLLGVSVIVVAILALGRTRQGRARLERPGNSVGETP